jgi:hypothetical protein
VPNFPLKLRCCARSNTSEALINSESGRLKVANPFGIISALYRSEHLPTLRHSTQQTNKDLLTSYVEPAWGKVRISEITPLEITRWLGGARPSTYLAARLRCALYRDPDRSVVTANTTHATQIAAECPGTLHTSARLWFPPQNNCESAGSRGFPARVRAIGFDTQSRLPRTNKSVGECLGDWCSSSTRSGETQVGRREDRLESIDAAFWTNHGNPEIAHRYTSRQSVTVIVISVWLTIRQR